MAGEQHTGTKTEVGLIHINKGHSAWAVRFTDEAGTRTFTRPIDGRIWSEEKSGSHLTYDIGSQTGKQLREIINKYMRLSFNVYENNSS